MERRRTSLAFRSKSPFDARGIIRDDLPQVFKTLEHDHFVPTVDLSEAEIANVFSKPIYQEVINSDAFRRLEEIRFLGAIDYVLNLHNASSRKRHTRFQHSLRVAQLALQYSRLCKLRDAEETILVIAGLLHDIGHAPLSHSLEPTFKERFGLTHHIASQMIILGKVPVGRGLPQIFQKYKIIPEDILALIEGTTPAVYVEAFKNPINIDTIEAIIRSYTYLTSAPIALLPYRVVTALVRRDQSDVTVLDEFWRLKDIVYNHLITSNAGLLADFVCRVYMKEHPNLWKGTYFHTESALRRKHSELFDRLREIKTTSYGLQLTKSHKVMFRQRRFFVDESVQLKSSADMYRRYRQTETAESKELSS